MKWSKVFFSATGIIAMLLIISLSACKKDSVTTDDTGTTDVSDDDFVTNTRDTTLANAVLIAYAGDTVKITNPFEGNGVAVSKTNGDVSVQLYISVTQTELGSNYGLSENKDKKQ